VELLEAPQSVQQQLVLESQQGEAVVKQPQASLPPQVLRVVEEEAQLEPAQTQPEEVVVRQPLEVAVEVAEQPLRARRVSCAQPWLQLPLLPYPLLLFVPPQLPHRQARENVRAPLPLRQLQSNWSAFFSR